MSGGFEAKPKLYELVWGDGDYKGLEATVKGVSTGAFLEIQEMAEGMGDKPKASEVGPLLRRFGNLLVAWNVTEDGQPVPAVYAVCRESGKPQLRSDTGHCEDHAGRADSCEFAGLAGLDLDLAMEIFNRWSIAVGGVDPTSAAGSNGGATSPGAVPLGLASASVSLSP
jgi:hypothetical protein